MDWNSLCWKASLTGADWCVGGDGRPGGGAGQGRGGVGGSYRVSETEPPRIILNLVWSSVVRHILKTSSGLLLFIVSGLHFSDQVHHMCTQVIEAANDSISSTDCLCPHLQCTVGKFISVDRPGKMSFLFIVSFDSMQFASF